MKRIFPYHTFEAFASPSDQSSNSVIPESGNLFPLSSGERAGVWASHQTNFSNRFEC